MAELETLILVITNRCNLKCDYCFVNKNNEDMSLEVAKKSIDFLVRNGKGKELKIGLFGGEPLLRIDLIKQIREYADEVGRKTNKTFRVGFTTNCTLFTDEFIDYCWHSKVEMLISWDGSRKRIVSVKGEEAYSNMSKAVKKLEERRINLVARLTLDTSDLDIISHMKHIQEMGFSSVVLVPRSGTSEWTQVKLDRALDDLANFYINAKEDILIESYTYRALLIVLGLSKPSNTVCGAGKSLLSVTSDGKILPCQHPETWLKGYILGNVYDMRLDNSKLEEFRSITRDSYNNCGDCYAKPICIGCCPERCYSINGNLLVPDPITCITIRARIKAAKKIQEEIFVKRMNPSFVRTFLEIYRWGGVSGYDIRLDINRLDEEDISSLREFHFKLSPDQLKLETGDKIMGFLDRLHENKVKYSLTKPLPPCIFRQNHKVYAKYGIPSPKVIKPAIQEGSPPMESKLLNCSTPTQEDESRDKYIGILNSYREYASLPKKCVTCLHRVRNKCFFAYFGLNKG